ncbi:ABC transporter permease [Rhizobium sp. XQZ8]|uniref:ABC transporter permease n=1 Tax=Rhizobium populisoli TaxID=2859785 RepID=UPI001C66F586|nr:ABC transporter permease [Rhizobium populisoli]MBW6426006.1 ABC transporter permease [Rhizobium populisoli]
MSGIAFWALISHWRRKPLQFATLILGVALATALWTGVQAINAEARASYARAASVLEQNELTQLVPRDGAVIPIATYARLRRDGWAVSPVIEGEYRVGTIRLRLIGIDPLTAPPGTGVSPIGNGKDLVDFISVKGRLIVSPTTARALQGKVDIALNVSDSLPDNAAFADISVADRLLQRKGSVTRLVVSPGRKISAAALSAIDPELQIREAGEQPDVARLTDSFHLNLTAFGFLSFIVGLFIVYAATGLSLEQRRATFRTLRAVGVSLRSLVAMLIFELTLFALASGVIGVVAGYFLATALMPGVASSLRGLYGAAVPGVVTLRPEWWVSGLAIAMIGTAMASANNFLQIWRMPILVAAQAQAWARMSVFALRAQAIVGAALLCLAAILIEVGSGLITGFTVLGCLLLGCALLLPSVLSLVLGLIARRSAEPLTKWFWADTRLQMPGLSMALMALLLALSANIGVGTMVSSFRTTFLGWLDQRLAAELYVTARDETEASRLRQWLPGRVKAVLPIWNVEGQVLGQSLQIFGVADDATYRDEWPVLVGTDNVWEEVTAGRGALINEQLWRGKKLFVGQPLALPNGLNVVIAGVYSDYGNPAGQVIIGIKTLERYFPEVSKLRYGLRVDPMREETVRNLLVHEFGLPATSIVDQAALKRQSRAVFEQTFLVTGALNVLTLAVAGFAMFSSLLTLSAVRLPQLAPVWAMGLRRRDLAIAELARTLALWTATFVAAIPLGLGLAWVLLTIINVEAFGWRLPMQIFPLDWLRLGAIALLAALVSMAIPVWRLATLLPAQLLTVFANER